MTKELHAITNGKLNLDEVTSIARDITPFITSLHIREKDRSEDEIRHWVEHLLHHGIPREKLILNRHFQMAGEYRLGGVQLPANFAHNPLDIKRAFPFLKIGASVHNLSEALFYQKSGADFLLFGNIYETTCKPGLKGRGISQLEELVHAVTIPVIALGGIRLEHVPELIELNISGIAVMSGVMGAQDPVKAVHLYQEKLKERSRFNDTRTI
ncbi:thiamine phosphate synthase [Pullulanibacillus sp. KACC 23026]|uniref:thiamine phosphate synthase n=1 Tax=Pullulanibacillus sp. KACC 23026 TaxID=3028315 RepID=UPI0023B1386F|nr:thiamine phosphate synthase [Pullulanibacillus sp. KACC 23026]WEG13328.1 thiamine phosphate synthase [Pullulanibacillus sp. KACC 23026]